MKDPATNASAATRPATRRQADYDDDLLVRMIAEGQLSQRKIADIVGVSTSLVSSVARGAKRPELHERICQLVEGAHTRARRRATAALDAVIEKHLDEALNGDGEPARKSREFIIRTFANTSDPAGRYVGLPGQGTRGAAAAITREELDLLAAVRGGPGTPTFDDLSRHMRDRLRALAPHSRHGLSSCGEDYVSNPSALRREQALMTAAFGYLDRCDRAGLDNPVYNATDGPEDDYDDDGDYDDNRDDDDTPDDEQPRFVFEDCVLPTDEPALRRELSILRHRASAVFGEGYLGQDADLEPEFTPARIAEFDAADLPDLVLASRQNAHEYENHILDALISHHLGDSYFDDGPEDWTAFPDDPALLPPDPSNRQSPIENRKSDIPLPIDLFEARTRHVLVLTRAVERKHFFQGRPAPAAEGGIGSQ